MKVILILLFLACFCQAYIPPIGIPEPIWPVIGNPIEAIAPVPPDSTPPANWVGQVFNRYYVDPGHAAATDTNNPYGYPAKPRLTSPNPLPAGAVVYTDKWDFDIPGYYYIRDGGSNEKEGHLSNSRYRLPKPMPAGSKIFVDGICSWGQNSPYNILAQGTPDAPVWIVNYNPNLPAKLVSSWEISQQSHYLILDGLAWDWSQTSSGGNVFITGGPTYNTSHICLRNGFTIGRGTETGTSSAPEDNQTACGVDSYGDTWATAAEHIVIHNMKFTKGGMWQYATGDPDSSGCALGLLTRDIWVTDCEASYFSGGAFGFGIGNDQTPDDKATQRAYIGRCTAHHIAQFAFWSKRSKDCIMSQNVAHTMRRNTPSSPDSGGYGGQYGPINMWVIYNTVYGCQSGIVFHSGASEAPGVTNGNVYIIGNLIYNIHDQQGDIGPWIGNMHQSGGTCVLIRSGGGEFFVVNNTFYDFDAGIITTSWNNNRFVEGNIFAERNRDVAGVDTQFNTDVGGRNTFKDNLIQEPALLRIDGVVSTSAAAINSLGVNKAGNIVGNTAQIFKNLANDFSLKADSPAIDKIVNKPDVYAIFESLYGRSIAFDQKNVARPQGAGWDIGALETETLSPKKQILPGIPEPWIQPNLPPPPRPLVWDVEIPNYYYIDWFAGTDAGRTYGRPGSARKTIPNPIPAGSRIEMAAGLYGGDHELRILGTADNPVWIIGAPNHGTQFTSAFKVWGSYCYIDGLRWDSVPYHQVQLGSASADWPADHIMMRNLEINGGGVKSYGLILNGKQGSLVSNCLIYNCHIHSFGNINTTTDDDNLAIGIGGFVEDCWVLNCKMHTCTAGLQLIASNPSEIKRFYVGGCKVYNVMQSGLWVKQGTDVVFSSNYVHDIIDTPWSPSKCIGAQYQPNGLWIINNRLEAGRYGIGVFSTQGDGTTNSWPIYIIGNTITGARQPIGGYSNMNGYGNAAIGLWGSTERYVLNNTLYDNCAGILTPGNLPNSITHIGNNLISQITEFTGGPLGGFPIVIGSAATDVNTKINNNLYYNNGTPILLRWNDNIWSLDSMRSSTGQSDGDLETNPQLTTSLSLGATSPAVSGGDAVKWLELQALYKSKFGVDLNQDIFGNNRVVDDIDIGAAELNPQTIPGIPKIPFGETESVLNVYGDANYYTHWIDNAHVNSSDENNTNGSPARPRKTLPYLGNLAAGSVVQLRGGPYTAGGTSPFWIGGLATAQQPIFIRGADSLTEIQRGIRVENGSHIIIENIKMTGPYTQWDVRPSTATTVKNIVVRDSTTIGTGIAGQSSGLGASGLPGNEVTDFVVIRCKFTKIGNWTQFAENDYHQLGVGPYTNRVWYGWNECWENGGDGVGNGHDANRTAKNYYIFNNNISKNHENGIDLKEVDGAIISGNHLHTFTGRESDPGTAIAIHYGPDDGPRNIFVLNNIIHNCRYGMQIDTTDKITIAGNIIYDIHWNKSPLAQTEPNWNSTYALGACMLVLGNYDVNIINNTFYDYDVGIEIPSSFNAVNISNNIFTGKAVAVAKDINIYGTSPVVSSHNLFTDGRIGYNGLAYTLAEAQAIGLEFASMKSAVQFTNVGAFTLSRSSPAVNAGIAHPAWSGMNAAIGHAATDLNGVNRPQGGLWDIGATEFSAELIDPLALPVNLVKPSIPLRGKEGDVVTVNPGQWDYADFYTYRWFRNKVVISGATQAAYQLSTLDVGKSVVCSISAYNANGRSGATSNGIQVEATATKAGQLQKSKPRR